MKRTAKALVRYKETCRVVWERAGGYCENHQNGRRCNHYIGFEQATWTNFAHIKSRYAESEDWVCDPDNIMFVCSECHLKDHNNGIKLCK